jgi:hypothetical protein
MPFVYSNMFDSIYSFYDLYETGVQSSAVVPEIVFRGSFSIRVTDAAGTVKEPTVPPVFAIVTTEAAAA